MQLETILCELGQISATGNALMQLDQNLCVGKNSILNFPAKFEQECAESFCKYRDDSSQCTAKASLEKGSSWPPGAIPHGTPPLRGLVLIQPISPTPWT